MIASPVVRWAGGKGSLLPELLPRVPRSVATYFEPFVGGGALFFAIASEAAHDRRSVQRFVIADQNEDLIAMYRTVHRDVDGLIAALDAYHDEPDLYYEVRALDPSRLGDVARAARMLFLNRTCYNGLWRVNARGRFNVPYGHRDLLRVCHETELRAAAALFARIDLAVVHADFRVILAHAGQADFVYADPPYAPTSKTARFTSYARRGFSLGDHQDLAEIMVRVGEHGGRMVLSNASTPFTRDLYAYHRLDIASIRVARSISADGTKRTDVDELLVGTPSFVAGSL